MGDHYSHFSYDERRLIKLWHSQNLSLREIGRRLDRSHTSVSRELKRNLWWGGHYYLRSAQEIYERRLKRRAQRFRLKNEKTRSYVIDKLTIGWTPELISGRLKLLGERSYICHESIYQYIYLEAPNLIPCLARKHRYRRKKYPYRSAKVRIKNRVPLNERPEEIEQRNIVGHWESDSVVGADRKCGLNVVIERASRLVNISLMQDKTAAETQRVVVGRLRRHPDQLVKSITYDNGSENVLHEMINDKLDACSYFCAPYHSWEKGSVEQANGLIRRAFPKGTDFTQVSHHQINALEKQLNNRPRKCLNFKTPYEVFREATGALTR